MHFISPKPITKNGRKILHFEKFLRSSKYGLAIFAPSATLLTLKMKIEAFIELKCAIVMLPVLCEKFKEPLRRDLVALIFIFVIRRLTVAAGEGWIGR